MRIVIASDIHGRLKAVKKLESVVVNLKPDKVILLGDYLYNGPRNGVPSDYDPMATSAVLNRFAILVIGVRGNCDSRVDESLLRFKMEDSRVQYLNGFRCDLIHGDLLTSSLLHVQRGDILMYGHTHVPVLKKKDGVLFVNPGSIAFPKEGGPATYAIMDGGHFEIRRLDDDAPIDSLDVF